MKRLLAISLMLVIFLPACTKEKVSPTVTDQVTMQLQKVIKDNGTKRVIAWSDKTGFPSNIPSTVGTFWTFSNGFITITGYGTGSNFTWNLLYLDSYDVSNDDQRTLLLHFKS
ncbi:MAG TPA: hypothetical protein VIQ23_09450 [Hanamia sp.]|jgi:hypothetical protein